MSKTAQEGEGSIESEYRKLKKELLDTKAELDASKESNKRLSTQNSKLRKKEGGTETTEKEVSALNSSVTEHSHPPERASGEEKKAQEEPKPPTEPTGGLPPAPGVSEKSKGETVHEVKSWAPRFCPDCGTKNPAFKDEVQCHSCKIGLGAKEKVQGPEFKVCPNCGKGKDNGGGWEYVPGVRVV